ncbi:unnamed protein product [Phytophthora fragariaefolia]|uniref:Unnamed protein product n=1 Tax=Phytophthora fragariaefolia TaxID=1490495 RepID=A0A9W6UCZ7_9STRA|nr:unnamed protein product [Phytophthora fragariaefolia]
MGAAVLHVGRRLVDAMPVFHSVFQSPTGAILTREQQTIACRSISQIACSLAMSHAFVLFSTDIEVPSSVSEQHQLFSVNFLELLLACSSYDDADVVQPTLEIWFFFLEDNSSQNEISWQLLDAAGQEHVVSVLSRLVNALIERCKYPLWFIERHQIISDDPEIESIGSLRREIADTMLSLFSKWPGAPGKPSGDYISCVEGISQMLSDCKDIALIDALLFLLSYLVELFDAVSSDSESEDDLTSFQAGGMNVLLGVLNSASDFPLHPLVINGIARCRLSPGTNSSFSGASVSVVFPGGGAITALQQLFYNVSRTIFVFVCLANKIVYIVQTIAQSSKYTTVAERAPLLQALLRFCNNQHKQITQESEGDLVEVTFRIACGVPDAGTYNRFTALMINAMFLTGCLETDFVVLCSSVLSPFTDRVRSDAPNEASNCVYLLGRALGGICDQHHGLMLVNQLWTLVTSSLFQHNANDACRHTGVQFFLNVIPHLLKEDDHPIETQILETCLRWYGEGVDPDILTCCSRIISRHRTSTTFLASVNKVFEVRDMETKRCIPPVLIVFVVFL